MNVKKLLLPVGSTDVDRTESLVDAVSSVADPGEYATGGYDRDANAVS